MTRGFCVCVPARDEADRLPRLLAALAAQDVPAPVTVALCVNNSVDGSADIARSDRFCGRLAVHVIERDFTPAEAHAGSARRAAMELGASLCGSDHDLLISTDADCRPPPRWIAATLAAAGDDLVIGGRIVLDPSEALPHAVAGIGRRWDAYWQEVRAIEDRLDPRPWDPPPRHGDHTGASLALPLGLYRRAGGLPAIASGEDRLLVDHALAAGGRLAHPIDVWTYVSPRMKGRAEGGMAQHMEGLHRLAAGGRVPLAPAYAHWRERALWRRATRRREGDAALARAERLLPPLPDDMPLPPEPA